MAIWVPVQFKVVRLGAIRLIMSALWPSGFRAGDLEKGKPDLNLPCYRGLVRNRGSCPMLILTPGPKIKKEGATAIIVIRRDVLYRGHLDRVQLTGDLMTEPSSAVVLLSHL
jgi:hypothetical protein